MFKRTDILQQLGWEPESVLYCIIVLNEHLHSHLAQSWTHSADCTFAWSLMNCYGTNLLWIIFFRASKQARMYISLRPVLYCTVLYCIVLQCTMIARHSMLFWQSVLSHTRLGSKHQEFMRVQWSDARLSDMHVTFLTARWAAMWYCTVTYYLYYTVL